MGAVIAPSILSADFSRLGADIKDELYPHLDGAHALVA